MRLWRVVPAIAAAAEGESGHPLWIPRDLQGAGRHDNPDLYGAMYLSEEPAAAVAEMIAHLRGQVLDDSDLERGGVRLSLTAIQADVDERLWDLDDPRVLVQRDLRPSVVATRARATTRRTAAELFRARPAHDGIRWWSILETSWMNVTLFDRSLRRLTVDGAPEPLRLSHLAVREAAERTGVRLGKRA